MLLNCGRTSQGPRLVGGAADWQPDNLHNFNLCCPSPSKLQLVAILVRPGIWRLWPALKQCGQPLPDGATEVAPSRRLQNQCLILPESLPVLIHPDLWITDLFLLIAVSNVDLVISIDCHAASLHKNAWRRWFTTAVPLRVVARISARHDLELLSAGPGRLGLRPAISPLPAVNRPMSGPTPG